MEGGFGCKFGSPFGSFMWGRVSSSESYRYGFGGHEKVDEVSGTGNTVDMGDRWLDVRLGRTPKMDAYAIMYPSISPYAYVANNPLIFIDPDGQKIRGVKSNSEGGYDYSKAAIKNGTKRYIEARCLTTSGTEAIQKLMSDKRTFDIMVTDVMLVEKIGGSYNTIAGLTKRGEWMTITTSVTSTQQIVEGGDPNDEIEAYCIDDFGRPYPVILRRQDFVHVLDNGDNFKKSSEGANYDNAYQDSGMPAFYEQYGMPTIETDNNQKIHGTGAHEETHLLEKPNMEVYDRERAAYDNEAKERREYIEQN